MANPSLKNGYLSIATELVEQLAKVNIPGNEMRIIWVVWRKTWGWKEADRKKDWDWIAISQFEKFTGMKHSNCVSCTKSLVVKRLLLKTEKGYKFNQNYNEWAVVKRLPPVVKRLPPVVKSILGSSQKHTATSSQKHTATSSQKHTNNRNIETIKETITKERIPAWFSDNQVLEVYQYGTSKGYSQHKQQSQSWAIGRLLKTYKPEQLLKAIDLSFSVLGKPYAPKITNFFDLEEKILKLGSFLREQQTPNKGVIKI